MAVAVTDMETTDVTVAAVISMALSPPSVINKETSNEK